MTTSSIYSIQYSRDDLITVIMRKMGVLAQGQTPTADNLSDGAMALNMAVAAMRGHGMPLWARTTLDITPTIGQASYTIGSGAYNYNTPYPLKIMQLYRTQNGTRIDMEVEGDYTFNQLPVSSTGVPIKGAYQPLVNYGIIKFWPVPDASASDSVFTLVYQKAFQYFNSSTDTMDFPEEWYAALVYQAAMLWAPEWGVPLADRNKLEENFQFFLSLVLGMGGEDASLFLQPYRQP